MLLALAGFRRNLLEAMELRGFRGFGGRGPGAGFRQNGSETGVDVIVIGSRHANIHRRGDGGRGCEAGGHSWFG